MTATASPAVVPADRSGRPDVVPPRSRPVLFWAALGAAQLVLAVYCIARWKVSGDMRATPPGPDEMAAWKTGVMWTLQILGPAVAVTLLYLLVIRPWRRDGRPSADGMLLVAFFAIAVPHDILFTAMSASFSYNAHYVNAGSWLGQVPGALIPNGGRVVEPLLLVLPAWGWCVFLPSVLGCAILRRLTRRWPHLRSGALVALLWAILIPVDFVFEMLVVFADINKYTGTIERFTFFAGTNHQMPMYEPVLWAAFYTGCSALRFFRNDRGQTFAERGAEGLRLSTGQTLAVRQLALIGATMTTLTVLFTLPFGLISLHNDSYPKNLPSYFGSQVCAADPATVTAALPPCPSAGPLARR